MKIAIKHDIHDSYLEQLCLWKMQEFSKVI